MVHTTFLPERENEAWVQTDPRHAGNFLALHGYDIIGLKPDKIHGAELQGVSKSGLTEYWVLPDWEFDFCETSDGYNTVVHDHPSGDAAYIVDKAAKRITVIDFDNKAGIENDQPKRVHTQDDYHVDGFTVHLHDWENEPFPFLGAALSRCGRGETKSWSIPVRKKEAFGYWQEDETSILRYSNIWGTFWSVGDIFLNGELSFMGAIQQGLQVLATRQKVAIKLGYNPPTEEDLKPSSVKVYWKRYFRSLKLESFKPCGSDPRRRRRRRLKKVSA